MRLLIPGVIMVMTSGSASASQSILARAGTLRVAYLASNPAPGSY